jgi:hypothetical protein
MTKRGQVWRYNKESQSGIIVGNDNQTYQFSMSDFRMRDEINEGNVVEFRADGQSAREIALLGTNDHNKPFLDMKQFFEFSKQTDKRPKAINFIEDRLPSICSPHPAR